jgi:hypothetical protein
VYLNDFSGYVFCDSCVRNVSWEFTHDVHKNRKRKGVCDPCFTQKSGKSAAEQRISASEMSVAEKERPVSGGSGAYTPRTKTEE